MEPAHSLCEIIAPNSITRIHRYEHSSKAVQHAADEINVPEYLIIMRLRIMVGVDEMLPPHSL
jgi:hypothetical protein